MNYVVNDDPIHPPVTIAIYFPLFWCARSMAFVSEKPGGKVDRKSVVCVGLLTTLSTRLFVIVSRPHAAAGADGDARHYQLDDVVNVMMREGEEVRTRDDSLAL